MNGPAWLAALAFLCAASAAAEAWYEGGTLHEATAGEWHQASPQNRLATAADFLAAADAAHDMRELEERAPALEYCITASTADPQLHAVKVAQVGTRCLYELGYR